MDPCSMSAAQAAVAIREGELTSLDLVESCLARFDEHEASVQAWQFLDRDFALDQARRADSARQAAQPLGPLHGVPVGVKDIFDTRDLPTENGSPLHTGRQPTQDASVVSQLRAAGAVILGKTVTTEFAVYSPGKTRNPHNPEHTPGGSSSGSAAAVACGMVPLALGSQTNGSVIRPAAFCGVYGFKPTHGLVSRGGVLKLSRTLDHVGMFARTLQDIALVAEQLVGADPRDPDTRVRARVPFVDTLAQEPPLPPMLAYIKGPAWERATAETQAAFAELVSALGDRIVEVEMPASARQSLDWHREIMEAEMAANLDLDWERGRERISPRLREMLERGRAANVLEYQRARARIPLLNEGFEEIFERCDAIVTPSAPGTAPAGLEATGDPAFCSLWTLCGMPALNLPLMRGENGLPMGVQLVGKRDDDARLLRTARWLVAQVEAGG